MVKAASLLGRGVYYSFEASHLLGISERTLRSWARPDRFGRGPLLEPSHGFAYSFHDLVSLAVIAVMQQRGVPSVGVERTIEQLRKATGLDRPLADRDVVAQLATVGRSVVYPESETDLSAGGQGFLLTTIENYIQPIEYGSDRLARLWKPADRVSVDPTVQVGHPCVELTRITTTVIAGRASQGESLEVIAKDLSIDPDDVTAAVAFERDLNEGYGLARLAA